MKEENYQHLTVRITGNVQGVSFRFYAKEKAEELGITGFARNEPDGSVYIEAEGDRQSLDSFLAWCRQGPRFAQVEHVAVEEGDIQNFDSFAITF